MRLVRGALERAAGGLGQMLGQGAQGLVALALEGPVAGPVRTLGGRPLGASVQFAEGFAT